MAFETIENVGKKTKGSGIPVPVNGVRVAARRMGRPASRGGGTSSFIRLDVGPGLVKKLCWLGNAARVRLLFGTGTDAGKIGMEVDNSAGDFVARRSPKGDNWFLSIGSSAADGLFSLSFDTFVIDDVSVVELMHKPPRALFDASADMLAIKED